MNIAIKIMLIFLIAAICTAAECGSLQSPLANERSSPLARLEPSYGCLTGVNLGWNSQTPVGFNSSVGWDHCVFVDFIEGFPHDGGYGYLDSRMGQVKELGGMYLATLEPNGGLNAVTKEACDEFAGWCAYWNNRGVPIFVRFAHEMNGDWYPWKMRPALYREKFRMLAESIHSTASQTAMVWAPNEGTSYPFGVYKNMSRADYLAQYGTAEDWALLDTNGDNVLGNPGVLSDHPYEPFYPGDDVVDWVGMTVYNWGTAYPWWYNSYPEARKFWNIITGNYNGFNGDSLWNPDFYAEYAEAKGKPMMIPETASYFRLSPPVSPDPFWPPQQTQDELLIKSLWIDQLFNISGDNENSMDISENMPLLKCVNWFNHKKTESEAQGDWVDWTVTSNPAVTSEYYSRLKAMKNNRRYFLSADDLAGNVYGWNSSLSGWTSGGPPFSASIVTDDPYEGRACVRINYNNTSTSSGKNAISNLSALQDDIAWEDHDVIYLHTKTPPGVQASFQLVMETDSGGLDVLGEMQERPNDGKWHTMFFQYDWTTHKDSTWLKLHLRVSIPNGAPATVYVDGFRTGMFSDLNSTNTITASAGEKGSISPIGEVVVDYGLNQGFTITPDEGCHVTDVLVDGVSVGAVTRYDFTDVTTVHTISASFASAPYIEHVAGVAFETGLPAEFAAAAKVTVKGLPAGLKYNAATKLISGIPTKPGTSIVLISAPSLPTQRITIAVAALPDWAYGSFNGSCVMENDSGTATMTVTALGKVTGKLSYGGKNYAFSAASYAQRDEEGAFRVSTKITVDKVDTPLTFKITPPVEVVPATLSVAKGWLANIPEGDPEVKMYRNVWKDAGVAVTLDPYIGYYTAVLPGGATFGSGYLAITVDKAGAVKTTGKLADGTPVSLSSTLIIDTNEPACLFTVIYTSPATYKGGCLFGIAEFAKHDNPADGDKIYLHPLDDALFIWENRNPQATGVYGDDGFKRELGLSGGWYDKIANLYEYYQGQPLVVGSDADAPDPVLNVGVNQYTSDWWNPADIALTAVLSKTGVTTGFVAPKAGIPVDPDKTNDWDYSEENTVGLNIRLTRATGIFKGSFKAWFDYDKTHTSRSILYEGVMTPERQDREDGNEGRGFYLWADKGHYQNSKDRTVTYPFNWSYDFLLLGNK